MGDIEKANVILTAHYDTCATLPIPNLVTPKNPLFTILYSLIFVGIFFFATLIINLISTNFINDFQIQYLLSLAIWFALLLLILIGPANKRNANDNTSGVIALCELMCILTDETRANIAFVLFDHEETGLIGSSVFRSKYKKFIQEKLIINLDCVSDGDHIMICATKLARNEYGIDLKNSFLPSESKSIVFTNAERTYYPSDQLGFKKSVAIAALKRKRFIGYYIDKIHTNKDTQFDKENIKLICESLRKFIQIINNKK